MKFMKRMLLLTLLLLLVLQGQGFAAYIPLDLSNYLSLNSSFSNEFGRKPGSDLLGVPFAIPTANADFFAFNDAHHDPVSMNVGILGASTAYLLINTNWGVQDLLSGRVTFKTVTDKSYVLDLVGGFNIRDWNQDRYTNSVTSPDSQPTGFIANPDMWGSNARIDLLTVQLPEDFLRDTLASITFSDLGRDGSTSDFDPGASRIRIEGVTIETAPVPEPSSLLLVFAGMLLMGWKFRQGRMQGRSSRR